MHEQQGDCDFYSQDIFFIAPFFVIDRTSKKALTLKISLEQFIKDNANVGNMLLSIISRRNNKKLVVTLLTHMIINKRIDLIGISKCFNKLNSIYKQAG